jgi:5-methylthioadenosine/S-adenosylhomocysteine deaminase
MACIFTCTRPRGEVLQAVEANGERPIDTLRRIGLLGPRTQCVHMTDLGAQDIASLAETGAHVVHCPQSNMKLASGPARSAACCEAGVNVALGTDSAASNNDLNLFNEMHSAALLAKLRERGRRGAARGEALEMATLGGARALGLEHGSAASSGQAGRPDRRGPVGPSTQPLIIRFRSWSTPASGSARSHTAGWPAGRPPA